MSVGYGKPPVASRFQPGRSGNPRGRPRKLKPDYRGADQGPWAGELLLDEMYRQVEVREGGKAISMTALQTVLRAMMVSAAKGGRLHAKLLLDHLGTTEQLQEQQRRDIFAQALAYKAHWAEACRLAAERGTTPEPVHLPHPDDVHPDFVTGTVRVDGPRTAREQRAVQAQVGQRDALLEVLAQADERGGDDPGERRALMARIAEIDQALPERLQLLTGTFLPAHQREKGG